MTLIWYSILDSELFAFKILKVLIYYCYWCCCLELQNCMMPHFFLMWFFFFPAFTKSYRVFSLSSFFNFYFFDFSFRHSILYLNSIFLPCPAPSLFPLLTTRSFFISESVAVLLYKFVCFIVLILHINDIIQYLSFSDLFH